MVPLKIHIKNFLSYGASQDIDFEPYPLICLSGKNGHGKSSLLDALTWALWGHARKASGVVKADEGLVHLGETHMMVILDFRCNGVLYRVKREFTLSAKKGHANLEFGILEKETGTYKPLTDKTIRATQDKIIYTIGLDYEGFVNSAFIRQGQSHEFSKKSPKERKDVLAALLGLEHFERVRRLALDTAKEAHNVQEQAAATLKNLEDALKEKQTIQEQLNLINATLLQFLEKEKALRADYEGHAKQVAQAQLQKIAAEKMLFKQEHLAKRIEEEISTIRTQARTWREVLRKQRSEQAVSPEQEREQLQKELHTLQGLGAQKLKLKEEVLLKREALRAHTQKLIDAHKQELEKVDRDLQSVAHALATTQVHHADLVKKSALKTKELEELTVQLQTLKNRVQPPNEALIISQEKQLERKKSYYHAFTSRAQSLKATIASILQKKQLVESSEQAVCPLCEQITDKDHLTQKFSQEEKLRSHQINRLSQVCISLKALLMQEHSELEALKKNRELQQILHVQLLELERQAQKSLSEGEALGKELAAAATLITQYTEQAQVHTAHRTALVEAFEKAPHDTLSATLQADLQRLEAELAKVPYDQEKERALALHVSALAEKSKQRETFFKELAMQDERKRTIHEKCHQARVLKKELEEVKQALPAASTLLIDAHLLTQEKLLRSSLETLTKEKEQLIHKKGSLEAQILGFEQKEQAAHQQAKIIQESTQLHDEYTAIASAFSKDGIQALLIEEALPEIEEEANLLLSSLTENQAHISIDSLRDTKSGKTKETLDIKISDAVGVRPYEMFSGGEAFRIDFALRIALAKLLARRAGTALETLIIDEGFGSQDEDGLSYIMQAIHTIRKDFEKVIIVSHLPSLKEQFPVHFEVQKTPQGSVVGIIEHC